MGVETVGWAQLSTDGDVSGFAIFRQDVDGAQEALVPMEAANPDAWLLWFDNPTVRWWTSSEMPGFTDLLRRNCELPEPVAGPGGQRDGRLLQQRRGLQPGDGDHRVGAGGERW